MKSFWREIRAKHKIRDGEMWVHKLYVLWSQRMLKMGCKFGSGLPFGFTLNRQLIFLMILLPIVYFVVRFLHGTCLVSARDGKRHGGRITRTAPPPDREPYALCIWHHKHSLNGRIKRKKEVDSWESTHCFNIQVHKENVQDSQMLVKPPDLHRFLDPLVY